MEPGRARAHPARRPDPGAAARARDRRSARRDACRASTSCSRCPGARRTSSSRSCAISWRVGCSSSPKPTRSRSVTRWRAKRSSPICSVGSGAVCTRPRSTRCATRTATTSPRSRTTPTAPASSTTWSPPRVGARSARCTPARRIRPFSSPSSASPRSKTIRSCSTSRAAPRGSPVCCSTPVPSPDAASTGRSASVTSNAESAALRLICRLDHDVSDAEGTTRNTAALAELVERLDEGPEQAQGVRGAGRDVHAERGPRAGELLGRPSGRAREPARSARGPRARRDRARLRVHERPDALGAGPGAPGASRRRGGRAPAVGDRGPRAQQPRARRLLPARRRRSPVVAHAHARRDRAGRLRPLHRQLLGRAWPISPSGKAISAPRSVRWTRHCARSGRRSGTSPRSGTRAHAAGLALEAGEVDRAEEIFDAVDPAVGGRAMWWRGLGLHIAGTARRP